MQYLYLLLVAVALYAFSDWALRWLESRLGRSLEQRSLVFFAILLGSAIVAFALIRQFAAA